MNAIGTDVQRPLELGIMFTHRCPIACRHCGILSGPDNFDSMAMELAERCITEAASLDPRPSTIVFTGGEPMMYPHHLERLLGVANQLGFATRVITNGFWGRNQATGRRLLYRLQLAGLDSLNFSADKFHLEFLPAEVFRRAIEIAWEAGFPVIVNTVLNMPGDPVALFSQLYGIPTEKIRLFDEDEFIRQVATDTVPPELTQMVNLSFGRLVGLGRAAEYPEEHYRSDLATYTYTPCQEVVNRPVIYPDGSFQACCCAGGKIASFTVGNVRERSLADLFDAMQTRTHFRFINQFGPRALHEAIAEMSPDRSSDPDGYASICDVCVAATKGLCAKEVDARLDHWLLKRFLEKDEISAASEPKRSELAERDEEGVIAAGFFDTGRRLPGAPEDMKISTGSLENVI